MCKERPFGSIYRNQPSLNVAAPPAIEGLLGRMHDPPVLARHSIEDLDVVVEQRRGQLARSIDADLRLEPAGILDYADADGADRGVGTV